MKYVLFILACLSMFSLSTAKENVSFDISVKKVLDMPSEPIFSDSVESNYYYKISHILKQESKVKVSIKSKDGEEIKVIYDGKAKAGEFHVAWDCDDDSGSLVSSGDYRCVIEIDNQQKEELISLK